MAIKFMSLLSLFLICSCSSTRQITQPFVSGNFWNLEDNTQIALNSEGSFVYSNLPSSGDLSLYTCCDTIAYGDWQKINGSNILMFSTPDRLNIPMAHMVVTESAGEPGVLEIIINSPLEDFYREDSNYRRDVEYRVELFTNSTKFELTNVNKLYSQNHIRISVPEGVVINGFFIEIIPTSFFGGQNIGYRKWSTIDHNVLGLDSMSFMVEMPDLSYENLTYLRLNQDYIYIKSSDLLLWDGKEYIRR